MFRIGVDLGGTKTEVAALDSHGNTVYCARQPTPIAYADKIETIVALVHQARERLESDSFSIGVGHPGSINPRTGLIRNANSTELNGHALDTDLSEALGQEVRCANDANCFTLSEATDGAGQDAYSVFGVILGTGVGGGFVLNGELLQGFGASAGEWGHTALPWARLDETPGPDCKCGLKGCLESWISGPALSQHYRRTNGQNLRAEMIVAAANSGDPAARQVMSDYYDRGARGLASVINILDPELIVLGGGLSNIPMLSMELQKRLHRYVFTDQVVTRVVTNRHGDSSGVRGAAWLWPLNT